MKYIFKVSLGAAVVIVVIVVVVVAAEIGNCGRVLVMGRCHDNETTTP